MTMIPEKYREKLPPYWYENEVANHHFPTAAGETECQAEAIIDLTDQFRLSSATWGLDYWEYIYQVMRRPNDSHETRRARVIAKHRARNSFTPAEAISITQVFSSAALTDITVTENPSTGYFYIAVPCGTLYDLSAWVDEINRRKRVPHVFVPQLTVSAAVTFTEKITVTMREYHKVREFRVGMTPLKAQSEVIL